MATEQSRRRRRVPFTAEEVEGVRAFKRVRERQRLIQLKRSASYKIQNTFNVICFFIFCELIFCYNGPCHFQKHSVASVNALYGDQFKSNGRPIVAEVDLKCQHGMTYKFIVDDYVDIPQKNTTFFVGKDFLLQKDLKGSFNTSEKDYRIFAASPILFLSTFTSFIMLFGIGFNLNENEHSLTGLTIISLMTLLCVVFM